MASNNVINFQKAMARRMRQDLEELRRRYAEVDAQAQELLDLKMADLEDQVLNGEYNDGEAS